MVNLTYRKKADGMTCITKCPYKEGRYVGSLACESCHYHFYKYAKKRQVICRYEDEHQN